LPISNLRKTHPVVAQVIHAHKQLQFLQHIQTQLKYSSYVRVTGKWVWVYTDWYNDRCQNVTWHRSL